VNILKNQGNHFFPNLNGLRFVGAFMVFVFHAFSLGREHWGNFKDSTFFSILAKITSKGHLGVSLFFVLSGFLITFIMLTELQKTSKIKLSNFIARRILRVWPLYFVVVIFGFFIFPILPLGKVTEHELINFTFFLSNLDEIWFGARDSLNFLTATWSVSVEEQFYLSWALLIGIFRFSKKQQFWIFFLSILLISIVFRTIFIQNERILYYHTLSVISDFAIGGILALLALDNKIQAFFERISKFQILLIYFVGIVVLFLESKIFINYLFVFQRIAIATFFAFIIAEQVYAKNSLFKLDNIPGLKKSGELTYGFYLFHCIVIYYTQAIFVENQWTESILDFAFYFILCFIITYISSWISFRYFESPILKLKKYFR
jgi:peptidoglycan/LPS O-acetylase OafA/YrhL